jgi:hypothetical protein
MKTFLLFVATLFCVTKSCSFITVITFNGLAREVYVKKICSQVTWDMNKRIDICKTYHEPKEHEILAGNIEY